MSKPILFSIISLSLYLNVNLLEFLSNSSWIHDGDFYLSEKQDTIRSHTILRFKDDKVVFDIRVEEKNELITHEIKNYVANDSAFRIDIGKRKNKAYLYGYIDRTNETLFMATSKIKTVPNQEKMIEALTDALWLDFTKN